jgi:hypothetical protein
LGQGRKVSVADKSRKSAVGRVGAVVLVIVQTAAFAGCASGNPPPLPTAADYGLSCADLVAEYKQADAAAKNRKIYAQSADATIGAATVVLAFATGGTLGMGLPLGAIALQRAKGDLGYANKLAARETIQGLAVRKGCTGEDEGARPAEAGAAAPGAVVVDPDASVFRSLRRDPN